MAVTTAPTSESRTEGGAILPAKVAAVLRLLDVTVITITAEIIRGAFDEHAGVGPHYGVAAVLAALLAVIIFHVNGLYRLKGLSFRHLREQLTQMSVGWGMVFVILILITFGLKISDTFSRLWIGTWFVLAWIEMATIRTLLVLKGQRWAAQGRFVRNVAIVGVHQITEALIERLPSDGGSRVSSPDRAICLRGEGPETMLSAHYRTRAVTIRRLVEHVEDPLERARFFEFAAEYEKLADHAE